jgi:hypothetical protein
MRILFALALFLFGAALLRAQDLPATPIDGPVVKADSLQQKPSFLPQLYNPLASFLSPLSRPLGMPVFETREQRAARENARVLRQMMPSIQRNMVWHRAEITQSFLRVVPMGYQPLQMSNLLIFAKIPGPQPYDNPASPENFPQTIKTEFDLATGTYKIVPRKWEEYTQLQFNRAQFNNFNNQAIPQVQLTPGDRIMR